MNDTITVNGEQYDASIYHKTSRATGTQQWVADQWAEGALPVNSRSDGLTLYTTSGNFDGIQYPEGHGKLKHYRHIQAIRTKSGLVIGDSSCYGDGMAHCSYPRDKVGSIDLTTLKANLKSEDETIYEITSLDDDTVTFESGRKYDLDSNEWVNPTSQTNSPNALGV